MNRFEMPKTSNDLIRTLQTILWAVESAAFNKGLQEECKGSSPLDKGC
jgi:hypothetical protein